MAEGSNAGDTQASQVNMPGGGNAGYKILLMNTEGPGKAERRQTAFKKLVDDLKPSIIFTQECNGQFLKCLGSSEYAQYPRSQSEAGFIYKVEFEHKDLTHDQSLDLDGLISRLKHPMTTKDKSIETDFDFKGRAQVSEFKCIKPCLKPAFLAISWHGVYKCSDQKKKKDIENLITVVEEVKKKHNWPYIIIGGDFNFDKKLWPKLPKVFRIHDDYTLSSRRSLGKKALIDVFVSTDGLNLTNTECYDLYRIKYLKPQGTDTKIRTWLKPGDFDLTEITINADGFNWTKVTILNPGGFDLTKLEIRNPEGVDWTEIIMIPEGSVLDEIKILNPEGFDLNQLMITKPEGFNLTNIETINPTGVDWTRIKIQIPPDFDWTEIKIQNPERFDLTKLKILKPEGFDCTKIEIQCSEGGQLTKLEILKPVGFDWTKIKIRKPKGFDLNKLEILMGKGQPLKRTKIKINYEVSDDGTEIKIRQPEVFDWTNIKILNPEGFDLTKLEILESKFFNLSTIKILNPQGYDLTKISNATDFFDHDPVQAYLTPQPDIEAITEGLAAASLESPTRVEPAEVPPPLAEAATTTTPPDIEVPAERLQAVRSPNEGRLSSTHAGPSPLAPRQHQPDRMFEGRNESTTAGTPVDATETSTENLMTIPRNGESSRTSAAVNAASSDEEDQEYDSDSPVEQTVVNV